MAPGTWHELDDRVFVRSYTHLRLNVGLIVGGARCLVIDTRSSHLQGQQLAAAVREVTDLPWAVVNTHAHFDHCFGNGVFLPAEVWGHRRCAQMLTTYGELQRAVVARHAREEGESDFADELDAVAITPPTRTFDEQARVDLGGRTVELRYLGRGHTDNDIVVVPDGARSCFAGDLIEQGAPPEYSDAFPLDWGATLERLIGVDVETFVPGHGEVVDRDVVRSQAETVTRVAHLARQAHADGLAPSVAAGSLPLPRPMAELALRRAYRQLDGQPAYDPPESIRASLGL